MPNLNSIRDYIMAVMQFNVKYSSNAVFNSFQSFAPSVASPNKYIGVQATMRLNGITPPESHSPITDSRWSIKFNVSLDAKSFKDGKPTITFIVDTLDLPESLLQLIKTFPDNDNVKKFNEELLTGNYRFVYFLNDNVIAALINETADYLTHNGTITTSAVEPHIKSAIDMYISAVIKALKKLLKNLGNPANNE